MELIKRIKNIYLYFVLFSIIGWVYELLIFVLKENEIINRGFLFGPWLPIYGFGGLIIYFCLKDKVREPLYIGKRNFRSIQIFLLISFSAAIIELASTYVMTLFGLDFRILWDYSHYNLNFDSRIALIPALQFGVLGNLILYVCQDRVNSFVENKSAFQYILMGLFTLDLVIHIFLGNSYTGVPLLEL